MSSMPPNPYEPPEERSIQQPRRLSCVSMLLLAAAVAFVVAFFTVDFVSALYQFTHYVTE
jgi:hypothetical protein